MPGGTGKHFKANISRQTFQGKRKLGDGPRISKVHQQSGVTPFPLMQHYIYASSTEWICSASGVGLNGKLNLAPSNFVLADIIFTFSLGLLEYLSAYETPPEAYSSRKRTFIDIIHHHLHYAFGRTHRFFESKLVGQFHIFFLAQLQHTRRQNDHNYDEESRARNVSISNDLNFHPRTSLGEGRGPTWTSTTSNSPFAGNSSGARAPQRLNMACVIVLSGSRVLKAISTKTCMKQWMGFTNSLAPLIHQEMFLLRLVEYY